MEYSNFTFILRIEGMRKAINILMRSKCYWMWSVQQRLELVKEFMEAHEELT